MPSCGVFGPSGHTDALVKYCSHSFLMEIYIKIAFFCYLVSFTMTLMLRAAKSTPFDTDLTAQTDPNDPLAPREADWQVMSPTSKR